MNSKANSSDIAIITDAIGRALRQRLNFFAYRLPADKQAYFGASSRITFDRDTTGFVVAPFVEQESAQSFVIPAQYGIDFPEDVTSEEDSVAYAIEAATCYEDYLGQANRIIEHLKQNGGKIVLSRLIGKRQELNIGSIFDILTETYPNAFVFCYFTPKTGVWIGASPELLLKSADNQLATMSLAGTRPIGSTTEWDDKCIEEQQIVTDYICDTLRSEGLSPQVSDRYSRQAGPVEHICNDIKANLNTTTDLWKVVDRLSPTPALSGYPKQQAISLIGEIERHRRRYYGGYIGPISETSIALYVNLRSMAYVDGVCNIYVGGGLTSQSVAEDEWQETEFKSQTLLKVIEKSHL